MRKSLVELHMGVSFAGESISRVCLDIRKPGVGYTENKTLVFHFSSSYCYLEAHDGEEVFNVLMTVPASFLAPPDFLDFFLSWSGIVCRLSDQAQFRSKRKKERTLCCGQS